MSWLFSPLTGYSFHHLAKVLATTNFEPEKALSFKALSTAFLRRKFLAFFLSMLSAKTSKQKMYTPASPTFSYIKWGSIGVGVLTAWTC